MKSLKYILMSLATGGLLTINTGCSDFLETIPATSVSDQSVFTSIAGAQAALNGCYYQMRAYNSGGANRWDDCGFPSVQMISDVSADDIIVWGGWYCYTYNYWGETRGDIFRASQLWTFHYRLINNVNSVIAYIDDIPGDQQAKNHIKGQALAMRGWAYFNLVRLFQHTYAIAKDMPGVPVYTEPTTDQTEGKDRGTVEETYKQVLADLTEAETLLEGYNRGSLKNNMDQAVVQGLLSDVYLTMTEWSKAETYAQKVLAKYQMTSNDDYLSGFNNINTGSWIWGMQQTEEQNMSDYSPYAMWYIGRDDRGYGYWSFKCFFLAQSFVEKFDANDVRASQFGWEWDMIHYTLKFRDNEDGRGSIVWMRTESMLLNAAEALCRQGKDDAAKELLWKLQDMRSAPRSTSTGNDLVEEILLERRKELYGEGYGLFDLNRNQKPLLRGSNHYIGGGDTPFPARSWRLIYQIPRGELLNNKALKDDIWPAGDQNPYDGVYEP